MKTICIFCGSNAGQKPAYSRMAQSMGQLLASKQIGLVYGGGKVGLMGILADAMLAAGGQVTGVIPDFLMAKEVGHTGISHMHVVQSMHQRKQLMADLSDAFIAMPGGIGTMEELFEVFTWGQLGLHPKPLGLLNVAGYYDALTNFLDHMVDEGFLKAKNKNMLYIHQQPQALLEMMQAYQPPKVEKWLQKGQE
ncbi:MAG: TIGR00730 family Rossman fold protein [Bacteroidetes bacterium]|nr:MAG: TIGR00730 family Rossman fold protein [Bacteroidota bacterium]